MKDELTYESGRALKKIQDDLKYWKQKAEELRKQVSDMGDTSLDRLATIKQLEEENEELDKELIEADNKLETAIKTITNLQLKNEELEALAERRLAELIYLKKKHFTKAELKLIKALAIYRTSKGRDKHLLPERKEQIKELLKKVKVIIK